MLKKCGFAADVAENGVEAMQAYDNKPYDLILMDCEMPEMDGFEATREIRRKEKENNSSPARIVALTAHAFDDIREQCLASGMDKFLTKPLQLQVVQDLLQEHLPGS
jgi:CheY-like chemotaxis protein